MDKSKTIPIALLTLCACFTFCISLDARQQKEKQLEIETENLSEKDRQNTVRLLKKFDKACSHITKRKQGIEPLKLRILFVNEELKDEIKTVSLKNGFVFVYLPASTEKWKNSQNILKQLIKTILLCKYGISPNKSDIKTPDWILSGLLRKAEALEEGVKVPGTKTYPGLHSLANADSLPDLSESLNRTIKRENGYAKSLNFEICELLLNSCSKLPKTKDDPFFETITNSEQKSSPAEIFKKTFGTLILAKNLKETPSLKQDQITVIDELSLNEWFHKEICKAAVNFLMPPSPEYAEKIFTEALMVRDGKTSYPLEDLPQKTETEKNRNLLALSILGKIGASQNELPPECRGFAIKIIAELDNFRMGKMENFTQNVRAAREGFMKTTAQMKKIRKVLEDYEKNYILPHERYSKYFRELSEIETENRKENQKLNIYLDRIEKEFGKEWK